MIVKSLRLDRLRAKKSAGLESKNIRMYDLRHCVATYMLGAGIPLPVVAGRLGHSSPAITAAVYSHALDSRAKEAAEALPPLREE